MKTSDMGHMKKTRQSAVKEWSMTREECGDGRRCEVGGHQTGITTLRRRSGGNDRWAQNIDFSKGLPQGNAVHDFDS